MCEYFLREETSKLVGGFLSQKKFRKGEYFCEYPKFGEDVWREHFKNLFIKKRVNRSISKLKKARKEKPMGQSNITKHYEGDQNLRFLYYVLCRLLIEILIPMNKDTKRRP